MLHKYLHFVKKVLGSFIGGVTFPKDALRNFRDISDA